jgi:nitroreductase
MDLIEGIFLRQSISSVKPDPVPKSIIEKLLLAAVQAPNHHRVRPWRFVVLTGDARKQMGEVFAKSKKKRNPKTPEPVLQVERERPLRSPLLIAVGVDKPVDTKVIEIENVCAAAAAVQNLLLAAQSFGLGVKWRTGPAAYDPDIKSFLGFEPDQHLIAFLYIGFLEGEWKPPHRPTYEDRTQWRS